MKINKNTILSKLGGMAVGACSGAVINKFLKSFVAFQNPTKLSSKFVYAVGIFGISGLISTLVTKDSEKDFSNILEIVDSVKEIRDAAMEPKEVPNIEIDKVDDNKEE